MNAHFDEMAVLSFLDEQLDATRAQEVSRHLESCSQCRRLFDALKNETIWLREMMGSTTDEMIPASIAEAGGARDVWTRHWGWIAAAALGLGGAYTFWVGIVSPWLDQAGEAGFSQGSLLTMLFFTGALWQDWGYMQAGMEILAAVTLGTVVVWLFRKHLRGAATTALVLGTLSMALAGASPAGAAERHKGDPNYILPAGQKSHGDLIVSANFTRIDGDVDGDLIVFSNSVTVSGHVKGDILGFVQELRMNGTVDGNMRLFCHSLILNGVVEKNVSSFVQNFDMDSKARIGGAVMAGANDAELDGQIGSDVMAIAHSLRLDGSVAGDVDVHANQLTIGSAANLQGHVKYTGWVQPQQEAGAKVAVPIEFIKHRPGPDHTSPRFYWDELLFWGVLFVFGLAMLLLAPGFFYDVARSSRRVGPAFGFGLIYLIVLPIAAAIACATIVGLGVGIVALLGYVVASFVAQIFVGEWIGEKILGLAEGTGASAGRLAIGLGVIRLVAIIPLVGPLTQIAVTLWGLGAMALAVQRRNRVQTSQPLAAA